MTPVYTYDPKVLNIVTLYTKYTRALTFENWCLGCVTVYKLSGVDTTSYSMQQQIERLEKALAAKDTAEESH
jgi:hypothetical protein